MPSTPVSAMVERRRLRNGLIGSAGNVVVGYAMYWHRPPLYNSGNFRGNRVNVFPNIVSLNMLCVHRSARAEIGGFRPVIVPDAVTS